MGCWDLQETYLERNFWLGDSWHWGAGRKVCPAWIRCQGGKAGGWPGGPVLHSDGLCVSSKDWIFRSQLQAFCGGERIFNYLFYFQRLGCSMQLIDNRNALLSFYENLQSLLWQKKIFHSAFAIVQRHRLCLLFSYQAKSEELVSFIQDLSP